MVFYHLRGVYIFNYIKWLNLFCIVEFQVNSATL